MGHNSGGPQFLSNFSIFSYIFSIGQMIEVAHFDPGPGIEVWRSKGSPSWRIAREPIWKWL